MNKQINIQLPVWLCAVLAVGIITLCTSAYFPNLRAKAGNGINLSLIGSDTVQISFAGTLSYSNTAGTKAMSLDTVVNTFSGSTATWTLPAIASNGGHFFIIVNKGTGNLTINSNAGGNDIYDNGAVTNSMVMLPGEAATIANDSQHWTTKP